MKRPALLLIGLAIALGVAAKLPAPSDEAKAKAAEAAAKAAWGDKVSGFQLCKAMDRVAATYRADAKKAGKDTKSPTGTPACADPGAFVSPSASAPAPAAAPAPATVPAKK